MRSKVSTGRPRRSRKYVKKTRNKKRASKGTRKRPLSRKRVSGILMKKTTKRKRYRRKKVKKPMRAGMIPRALDFSAGEGRGSQTDNEMGLIVRYLGDDMYLIRSLRDNEESSVETSRIIPYSKTTGERDVSEETRTRLHSGRLPVNTIVELRPIESDVDEGYATDIG